MKKLSILLSTIALTTYSSMADEAKLVQLSLSGGLPEGTGFDVKPQGYKYGATLTYFIEGQNLIGIDKESLTAEGWEMGFWPKVSKDGTSGSFSIYKKGNFLSKPEAVKVTGSVKVITGSAAEKKSQILKKGENYTLGSFTVSLELGSKWNTGVKLKGDLTKVKSISVTLDGKKLKQSGWGGGGNARTYNFKGIKEGAEVTLEQYTKTGSVTYTFSK